MTVDDFAVKVISIFNKHITDEIFLFIQNDKKLMHEYLYLVEKNGLENVNKNIGKKIEKIYNLTKYEGREKNPKSNLIKSHQKFN